jgi:hypothetical protein
MLVQSVQNVVDSGYISSPIIHRVINPTTCSRKFKHSKTHMAKEGGRKFPRRMNRNNEVCAAVASDRLVWMIFCLLYSLND